MTTQAIQASLIDPELKKVLETFSAAGVQTNLDTANTTSATTKASVIVDLNVLRDAIIAVNAKLDTLATKLNADGGVTDTNYATDFASATDPAAMTTT